MALLMSLLPLLMSLLLSLGLLDFAVVQLCQSVPTPHPPAGKLPCLVHHPRLWKLLRPLAAAVVVHWQTAGMPCGLR
jgi:hypothetical protein